MLRLPGSHRDHEPVGCLFHCVLLETPLFCLEAADDARWAGADGAAGLVDGVLSVDEKG